MKILSNNYIECTRLESRVLLLLMEETTTKKEFENGQFYISDLTNEKIANSICCSKFSVEKVIKSFYDTKILTLVYEVKRKQLRSFISNFKICEYKNRKIYLEIKENYNLKRIEHA